MRYSLISDYWTFGTWTDEYFHTINNFKSLQFDKLDAAELGKLLQRAAEFAHIAVVRID